MTDLITQALTEKDVTEMQTLPAAAAPAAAEPAPGDLPAAPTGACPHLSITLTSYDAPPAVNCVAEEQHIPISATHREAYCQSDRYVECAVLLAAQRKAAEETPPADKPRGLAGSLRKLLRRQ
jgi:hypothetical protein